MSAVHEGHHRIQHDSSKPTGAATPTKFNPMMVVMRLPSLIISPRTTLNSTTRTLGGWAGCGQLPIGQTVCLSKGTPPSPAPVSNAVCGPQVPGTQAPSAGTNISIMNPCPLNASCDAWGLCGTTSEFCTPSLASTGAPGTHKAHTNGCISNCGTDIVNNGIKPANPLFRVGYFGGYNFKRSCLNTDVS